MVTRRRKFYLLLSSLGGLSLMSMTTMDLPPTSASTHPWQAAVNHAVPAQIVTPMPMHSLAAPGDTSAVHFVTQSRGYAVTGGGSILISKDGGQTWETIVDNQSSTYHWLRWNGKLAAAVGTKWVKNHLVADIATSEDNGLHWQSASVKWPTNLNSPPGELQAYPISAHDVWMLPTPESVIAGMPTPIWQSVDDGKSWTKVHLPKGDTPTGGIATWGKTVAITVGDPASRQDEVLMSNNGGKTWRVLVGESKVPIYALAWKSPHQLLVGGGNLAKFSIQPGEAILSVDTAHPNQWRSIAWLPGDTRVYQPIVDLETSSDGSLYALCGGIAMGGNLPAPGLLLHFSPAGRLLRSTSTHGGTSVSVVGNHIWLASEGFGPSGFGGSGVKISTNGGRSWVTNIQPSDIYAVTIQFVTSKTGFAMTQIGWLQTRDGGLTWKPINLGNLFGSTPFWVTPSRAFATTSNGVVQTSDGGHTWHPLKLPQPVNEVNTVAALPGGFVAVAYVPMGSQDRMPGRLSISHDNGKHWNIVSDPFQQSSDILQLSFVSTTVGYAYTLGASYGQANEIWMTQNGGQTWSPMDVFPLNVSNIALCANSGGLVFSAGDGPIWTKLGRPLPNNVLAALSRDGTMTVYKLRFLTPQSVSFVTPEDGWLTTTGTGYVFHTQDGGKTWMRVWL